MAARAEKLAILKQLEFLSQIADRTVAILAKFDPATFDAADSEFRF